MEPIQVTFTFTPESFRKAQLFILLRFLSKGWIKWILIIGGALWLLGTYFLGGQDIFELLNTLIWIPVFVGFWWVIFRWLSRRNFTKLPMLQHPIRYIFEEQQVSLSTQTSQSVLQWETFQKVEEAREFFLLYQNAFLASPLLKSGFQNETELERFRTLLRSKQLWRK